MPRTNDVWYRKSRGCWMSTIAGKQVKLLVGPNDKHHRELAEEALAEYRKHLRRNPKARDARVADIIESFLRWAHHELAPATYKQLQFYGQRLAEFCGLAPAAEITPHDITEWVQHNGWKGVTAYNAKRHAFRCFSWAVGEGLLDRNPLQGLKRPKPKSHRRALTDAEFRALIEATDDDFRPFLMALRLTGARPQEMRNLKWSDIEAERIVLRQHKTDRTGKPRVIYLSRAMAALLASVPKRSEYVFLNRNGRPWTANAVRLRIMRLKKKLGLDDDVCAYLLRHAFGTNAILKGLDVATVAELMGHASTEITTGVYPHLSGETRHLQTAMERAVDGPPCPEQARAIS